MKVQVLQEKLSKALNVASRFASPKAQLPVLGNVLLKTNKNKLLINATNLELSVSLTLGAKVERDGEITIPAKALSDIVGNLNPDTVTLESEKESLLVSTEDFEGKLAGMNSSDFPSVPEMVDAKKIEINPSDLEKVFTKLLFAVSSDESRPALSGVLFVFSKDYLEFVATDGFRLSLEKLKIGDSGHTGNVIVPKAILSELSRQGDGQLSLSFDKENGQIIAGSGDIVLASRLIEAGYPPYEKIIPKSSDFMVDVDKQELLRAIKVAGVYGRDSADVVKLAFTKKAIEVFSESKSLGKQKGVVDAKIDGDPFSGSIAFNFRFVEDVLNACGGDSINMSFTGVDAPGVFRDPVDKDFLHLIMPVKIQD